MRNSIDHKYVWKSLALAQAAVFTAAISILPLAAFYDTETGKQLATHFHRNYDSSFTAEAYTLGLEKLLPSSSEKPVENP